MAKQRVVKVSGVQWVSTGDLFPYCYKMQRLTILIKLKFPLINVYIGVYKEVQEGGTYIDNRSLVVPSSMLNRKGDLSKF